MGPKRPSVGLGALAPAHQIDDRGGWRHSSAEQGVHLRRNRQLDAESPAQSQSGPGGSDALSHHLHPVDDVADRPATRQLDPDVTVATEAASAREDEVAHAGQPR